MAAALLPDRLWDLIEPFLPILPRRPQGGRPRVSDRACLTGIVFVLRSGIPWRMLPQQLGCGSGMTCWRRLRDWQRAGVWDLMHFALLDWLARSGQIDWSRAVVDSCSIRAVYGGDQTGPNPTDRAKRGSKRHLICDGRGVPLAVRLTGANRNDSQEALALVDAILPLQGDGDGRGVADIVWRETRLRRRGNPIRDPGVDLPCGNCRGSMAFTVRAQGDSQWIAPKKRPVQRVRGCARGGRVEVVYQMNQRDAAVDFGLTVM
jgi:transposase